MASNTEGQTWMPASGSCVFTDADGYQASLLDIFDLLVLEPHDFHARLTWVELPILHLLRAQESSSRVVYMTLPAERVFVIFPVQKDSLLIVGGVELQFGDIMFHSLGDQTHQRTAAGCQWGSISLPPSALRTFSRTIAGHDLAPPAVSQVLRLLPGERQTLLRLHAQAGRIAETDPNRISSKEVVRALEQDLILALITSLTTAEIRSGRPAGGRRTSISAQLEATLAAHHDRQLSALEISNALGVSTKTLKTNCTELFGMTPGHYQRLKRLKRARTELMRTNPPLLNVAQMLKCYGFASLQRFAIEYWEAYGELPPIPPRVSASQSS